MLQNRKESRLEPIGLTIQLQKYGIGKLPELNNTVSPIVLGYYDNLTIDSNYLWLDFSPEKILEKKTKKGEELDSLATYYPIKLLFPRTELMETMQMFSYSKWKNHSKLLDENPCMMLVLVNLTDSYRQENGTDLLKNFLKLIQEKVSTKHLGQVSCCVLPSIGYSDFCILMADIQWQHSMNLVEQLRNLKDTHEQPVISTDYIVPVFHGSITRLRRNFFQNIELTVRVNLEPGVTVEMLAGCAPTGIEVFRTSGSSDCILHTKRKDCQTRLIKFLLSEENSRNFVMDMASTLQLKVKCQENVDRSKGTIQPRKDDYTIDLHDFNCAVSRYDEMLIKKFRHRRQANSLRELANSVANVCSQRHTQMLRQIMKSFMEDFTSCLDRYTEQINKANPQFDLDEAGKKVAELCRIVSSFLTDLSRSDCFFMEQEKYSHTSVSSATSLLLAYNIWINDFTKKVQEVTQKGNESHYSFLVTSGGLDQTLTFDAFNFLEPSVTSDGLLEKMVLVTRMSEMGLYDLSGTIFRAAHECMHFCGMRLRQDRLTYLTGFVASILAKIIAQALFQEENTYCYVKDVYRELYLGANSPLGTEPLLQTAKKQYDACLEEFEHAIADKILEYFIPDEDWTQETNYILNNVEKWMYDVLLEAFSVYNFFDEEGSETVVVLNALASWLYEETQKRYLKFYQESDALFGNHGLETALFSFEYNKQHSYFKNGIDGKDSTQDLFLHRRIQLILSRLLINLSPYALDPKAPNDPEYKYWKQKVPYVTLIGMNIQWVLDVTKDVFAETFADVIACKILDVDLADYLLSHIYEDWDLDSSLPKETPKIFRIAAVLRLCFPGALSSNQIILTCDARQSIADAANRLIAHGVSEKRLDANALCNRVDDLLNMFKEHASAGQYLLDYLGLCIDEYEKIDAFNKLKPFAEGFKRIRLHTIDPNAENTRDKIVEMYYALINVGSGADG